MSPERRIAVTIGLLGSLLLVLAGTGCAPAQPELELVSYRDPHFPQKLTPKFELCAYRTEARGDVDIVARAASERVGESEPATHYLHIRRFWRPHPGKTPDNPSVTDATLRYLIVGSSGRVLYTGTGFAYAPHKQRRGDLTVELERGVLQLDSTLGEGSDLLGECRISGKLKAADDRNRAVDLLREMELAAAGQ